MNAQISIVCPAFAVALICSCSTAFAQHDVANMPGMASPTPTPAKKIPRTSGATKQPAGMQGMQTMEGMNGMPAKSAPQPWAPPPGDDRRSELQSLDALKAHMQSLGTEPVHDLQIHSFFLSELLEYRANSSGPDTFVWDMTGWIGGDVNRFWYATEGSQDLNRRQKGEGDLQLLYGRLIAPYWDLQIGARTLTTLGTANSNTRTYASLGLVGIAPYQFDIEAYLFISDRGDVSFRPQVAFEWLLTQHIVLEPRIEVEMASGNDKAVGVGSGVNSTDLGVRLRYEIRREFAPYIGVSWLRLYGNTAKFARDEDEADDAISFVAGLRLWF